MAIREVVSGLWEVPISIVNVFLLDTGDGLVVIDTGIPGSAGKIIEAIREIGRNPSDVRQILVTHCHSDHSGSLAELKRLTGAPASMHPTDAAMLRNGKSARPLVRTPGPMNWIICTFFIGNVPTEVEPAEIETEIRDGDTLAGGLRAIHVPGHCAGQLAFLWPEHGGVLIAADAAANVSGLALSPMYEDLAEGKRSLAKLGTFEFEVACFGHGRPIKSAASTKFRKAWPA